MSISSSRWEHRRAVDEALRTPQTYGGRRLGFIPDDQRAEFAEAEQRLLERARRVVRRAA